MGGDSRWVCSNCAKCKKRKDPDAESEAAKQTLAGGQSAKIDGRGKKRKLIPTPGCESKKHVCKKDVACEDDGCEKYHIHDSTSCECGKKHLSDHVRTQKVDVFERARSLSGAPCANDDCRGKLDIVGMDVGFLGNAAWYMECDTCSKTVEYINMASLPEREKPDLKRKAGPSEEGTVLGHHDRPYYECDEARFKRIYKEGGAEGARVLASATRHCLPVGKLTRFMSDIDQQAPSILSDGLASRVPALNAALRVGDTAINDAFLHRNKCDGEPTGSIHNATCGADGCWSSRKNSTHGCVCLTNQNVPGVLVEGVCIYSRKTTPSEAKLGLPSFPYSAESMEPKGTTATLKKWKEKAKEEKQVDVSPDVVIDGDALLSKIIEELCGSAAVKRDLNHVDKGVFKKVDKLKSRKDIDQLHSSDPSIGGCPYYVDPKTNLVNKKLKACSTIDEKNQAIRFNLKPALRKHMIDSMKIGRAVEAAARPTRSRRNGGAVAPTPKEVFKKAWKSNLVAALGHCFGDHTICNPQECPDHKDSLEKRTRTSLSITCKPMQNAILATVRGHYSDDILDKVFHLFATQANEAFNGKIAMQDTIRKGKFSTTVQYHTSVAITTADQNEQALPSPKELLEEKLAKEFATQYGVHANLLKPSGRALAASRRRLARRRRQAAYKHQLEIMRKNNAQRTLLRRGSNGIHVPGAYAQQEQRRPVNNVRGPRDPTKAPKTRATLLKHITTMWVGLNKVLPRADFKVVVDADLDCYFKTQKLKGAACDAALQYVWYDFKLYQTWLDHGGTVGEWEGRYAPPVEAADMAGDGGTGGEESEDEDVGGGGAGSSGGKK